MMKTPYLSIRLSREDSRPDALAQASTESKALQVSRQLNRESAKRWTISATVASNRRNLFDLTPGEEHQIATLVSGSRSQLTRFEHDLAIIEAAPVMLAYLTEVLAGGVEMPAISDDLRLRIERLVQLLDRSNR